MEYTYWLPDETGGKKKYSTNSNAVIIIGANGAGKSKLGAWIEQQSFSDVHRIGAQRNLNFNEHIQLKSYSEAENWVFYGNGDGKDPNKGQRWQWGHYTTRLMDDFDHVLSALLAIRNNEISKFHQACVEADDDKSKWPNTPTTSIEKLIAIWSEVLPQRKLKEEDSQFFAVLDKNGEEVRYSSTDMSDGERAVLYLVAQVLCVPENKIMIIDEPEIHLHRSIMNRLWKTLERYRPDCLFIYITHDLQFAAAHGDVDKIWIKEYDGEHWAFESIANESIPEELMLEIIGSRKNVLFVEGEKNSYDYQLYTELYPEYIVIPCGGCSQVIARTRAFRNSVILHDCKVYGLIDRDYRTELEIKALNCDGIFVLEVAEVENLFLVEELIRLMAIQFGSEDVEQSINEIKEFVINTKFKGMIERQICQSVVSEIKYQLSCIEIEKKNETEAKSTLKKSLDAINYDDIKNQMEPLFYNALNSNDYKEVLRIFNEKGIAASIGIKLGVDNREYQRKVINLLRGACHDEIVRALAGYLPCDIPRCNGSI